MARPRKQPAPPTDTGEPPVAAQAPKTAVSLKDFISHHEKAAQEAGVVVAAVNSPGEDAHVHVGAYSGIRVSDGPRSATYSDGSKH